MSLKFRFIDEKIAFYSTGGISSTDINNVILENVKVMQHYAIDQSKIALYRKRAQGGMLRKPKNILKFVIEKIGLIKLLKILRGWKNHSCSQKKCRWCGRDA